MRYRALIVDDELIILNGILHLPVWASLDIEPVPAQTGIQALEHIKSSKIDMIITDIKMPEMNGLQMIDELRKLEKNTPVIVISGYDSFAYAQKAIHYGVKDYLLKPVSQSDLDATVRRMIEEIEAAREKENQAEVLRGKVKETVFDSRSRQLEACLLGNEVSAELRCLTGDQVQLILCLAPKSDDACKDLYHLNQLLDAVYQAADADDMQKHSAVSLFMGGVVLLFRKEPVYMEVMERLRTWSEDVGMPFVICCPPDGKIDTIENMYREAARISVYRFYQTGFCILTEDSAREATGNLETEGLEEAVKTGNPKEAYQRLEQLLVDLRMANHAPEDARKLCTQLYLSLSRQINQNFFEIDFIQLLMERDNIDLDGLAAMLHQLLCHWEAGISERRQQSYSRTVRTAIQYVQEHFDDETLTIAELAGRVLFIHPDYFGKLFKKETGISFTRYLMDLRMDQAKKLIHKKPDIKVCQLSEETGFGDNPHYFSQAFRSCCGCTPSEYKKAVAVL